jgi:hypothetical protein
MHICLHQRELSGQHRAPSSYHPLNEPAESIGHDVGWVPELFGRSREESARIYSIYYTSVREIASTGKIARQGTTLNLTFMGPCIVNVFLNATNKMQRCIRLFIIVNAVHVFERFFRSSSGAQICTCRIRYLPNLSAATSSMVEVGLSPYSSSLEVTANKLDKYLMLHVQI